ncbi:hypothetical protein DA391_23235 (plasmid) [Yersinia massiliensis]|uniref:Uncharacterized protein n=1 Tax=Yersinia massiliensis TaxID=419257 RepID=A0ABM6UZY5_9GAMM|nr:hypothetical protein DA391_23235 [Yersinia massiliensis]
MKCSVQKGCVHFNLPAFCTQYKTHTIHTIHTIHMIQNVHTDALFFMEDPKSGRSGSGLHDGQFFAQPLYLVSICRVKLLHIVFIDPGRLSDSGALGAVDGAASVIRFRKRKIGKKSEQRKRRVR